MAVPRVHEHGITVLFEAENPTVDIVFVHGFTGSPQRTWTFEPPKDQGLPFRKRPAPSSSDCSDSRPSKLSRVFSSLSQQPTQAETSSLEDHAEAHEPGKQRGVYWPFDLVPITLPHSRVLTYGYDTNIRSRLGGSALSHNSVDDHGRDLLNSLANARRDAPSRPLVFVAHSLGGIVSKIALIKANESGPTHPHLRSILQSTVGLLFFGTPHRGADPLSIAHHVLKSLVGLAFQHNHGVAQTLLRGGDYLRTVQDGFAALARRNHWSIFSFQEEYPLPGLLGKKVVEDESSCINDRELESRHHIAKNHREMVRFSGGDDPEYRKVESALLSIHARLTLPHEPVDAHTPSQVNEPPDSETVARRQELAELLYFDQIDSRLLSLKTAHNKTCSWFLDKEEYRQWLTLENFERHHGFLWIKGKPGSGKSILMKFLEHEARRSAAKESNRLLASFFFFAPGKHLEKSTLGVYRYLLWKLFQEAPDLQEVLDALDINACRVIKKTGWQIEALKQTIAKALEHLGDRDLTVFIDALDECRDDDVADMVSFFEDLGERAAELDIRLRICFSSRHYPFIELTCGFEIKLEDQDEHSQDIARYISSKLKLSKSKRNEDFRDSVLEKSAGIFLWVALVIPMLNKAVASGRVDQLQKHLSAIPAGLDNLFDMVLARDDTDTHELQFCIQLILFSVRPVTLSEYFFALRRAGDGELHEIWAADPIDRDAMIRFAQSSSKGLAEATKTRSKEKEPTVQFIHESVRDFFFKEHGRQRLWPSCSLGQFRGLGHDALKLRCWDEIKAFRHWGLDTTSTSTQEVVQKWPFLRYATDNTLAHSNYAQQYGVFQTEFLSQFTERQQDWVTLHNFFEKFSTRRYKDPVDILYVLAEHGLDSLLQIHPRLSSHMDIQGGRHFLPLAAALVRKRIDTVRILLAALNPDPSFTDGVEECVATLARGINCELSSMDDFNKLILDLGHRALLDYCIENLSWCFCQNILKASTSRIRSVVFSPDSLVFAFTSHDEMVQLWDTAAGTCQKVLEGHTDTVSSVAFSPCGLVLASGSHDQTVRLWDAAAGTCQKVLEGHTHTASSVAFSPCGLVLASGSHDQTVRLWDVASGTCQKILQNHTGNVLSVTFLPGGSVLATGSFNGTVRLWDVASGTCQKILQNHTGNVLSVTFSPGGSFLATGSFDGTVRLWDVASGTCQKILQNHTSHVLSVTFSPCGLVLASSSHDQTVRLWDVAAGTCQKVLQGHSRWIRSTAFSPDGLLFASGSDDGTVRLWNWKKLSHL